MRNLANNFIIGLNNKHYARRIVSTIQSTVCPYFKRLSSGHSCVVSPFTKYNCKLMYFLTQPFLPFSVFLLVSEYNSIKHR